MTLPAFASLDDLEVQMGPVDDPIRAQAALERASTLIRVEAGTSWVTDGELDFGDLADYFQDAIVAITVDAARRALDTPSGIASESVGDASVTYDDPSGNVYLRAAERATIRSAAGRRGITTIATTREGPVNTSDLGTVADDGTIYAEVSGGQPIPWLDGPDLA